MIISQQQQQQIVYSSYSGFKWLCGDNSVLKSSWNGWRFHVNCSSEWRWSIKERLFGIARKVRRNVMEKAARVSEWLGEALDLPCMSPFRLKTVSVHIQTECYSIHHIISIMIIIIIAIVNGVEIIGMITFKIWLNFSPIKKWMNSFHFTLWEKRSFYEIDSLFGVCCNRSGWHSLGYG